VVVAWANVRFKRVGDGALVGQPGQAVGRGADLRDGQVAEVGQHGRGLADRLADPLLLRLGVPGRAAEQHRADHLAAHGERDARGGAGNGAAHRAGQQDGPPPVLAVRPARPDRQARARLGATQGPGQRRAVRQRRDGLQPVRAVVPVEDHGGGRVERALEMALEQLVRLVLVVGDLQDVGELRLGLAGLEVPADAPEPVPQEQQAEHQTDHRDADQQAGGVLGAGRGLRVVGVRIAAFLQDQLVQVRADRLVGGGQLGGERAGGLSVEVVQAEQVTDGGPLPDEQLEVGELGRRVADVQLFQREQLRVDRGQQAGVERAEQPGLLRGLGGLQDFLAGRIRGIDIPGQLVGHDRGGQLVARDRIALARGRPGGHDADGGHPGHHDRERDAECDERAGRGPSERPHTYAPNPAA